MSTSARTLASHKLPALIERGTNTCKSTFSVFYRPDLPCPRPGYVRVEWESRPGLLDEVPQDSIIFPDKLGKRKIRTPQEAEKEIRQQAFHIPAHDETLPCKNRRSRVTTTKKLLRRMPLWRPPHMPQEEVLAGSEEEEDTSTRSSVHVDDLDSDNEGFNYNGGMFNCLDECSQREFHNGGMVEDQAAVLEPIASLRTTMRAALVTPEKIGLHGNARKFRAENKTSKSTMARCPATKRRPCNSYLHENNSSDDSTHNDELVIGTEVMIGYGSTNTYRIVDRCKTQFDVEKSAVRLCAVRRIRGNGDLGEKIVVYEDDLSILPTGEANFLRGAAHVRNRGDKSRNTALTSVGMETSPTRNAVESFTVPQDELPPASPLNESACDLLSLDDGGDSVMSMLRELTQERDESTGVNEFEAQPRNTSVAPSNRLDQAGSEGEDAGVAAHIIMNVQPSPAHEELARGPDFAALQRAAFDGPQPTHGSDPQTAAETLLMMRERPPHALEEAMRGIEIEAHPLPASATIRSDRLNLTRNVLEAPLHHDEPIGAARLESISVDAPSDEFEQAHDTTMSTVEKPSLSHEERTRDAKLGCQATRTSFAFQSDVLQQVYYAAGSRLLMKERPVLSHEERSRSVGLEAQPTTTSAVASSDELGQAGGDPREKLPLALEPVVRMVSLESKPTAMSVVSSSDSVQKAAQMKARGSAVGGCAQARERAQKFVVKPEHSAMSFATSLMLISVNRTHIDLTNDDEDDNDQTVGPSLLSHSGSRILVDHDSNDVDHMESILLAKQNGGAQGTYVKSIIVDSEDPYNLLPQGNWAQNHDAIDLTADDGDDEEAPSPIKGEPTITSSWGGLLRERQAPIAAIGIPVTRRNIMMPSVKQGTEDIPLARQNPDKATDLSTGGVESPQVQHVIVNARRSRLLARRQKQAVIDLSDWDDGPVPVTDENNSATGVGSFVLD